ncbi:DUF1206 domain-containing protein [Rubrivirga marina]|uniref:DUF1206 domain-containing protein n=1 Tax=Rubrivirga marina TaxID=1196024 RepID=A0A271J2G8_9BACT|nr:DUF1206 domain-containing protein [Rubrivirga marina]PAP77550.1 hypothetical protein BSZ37_14420 [Rubrivirga marina]
MSTATSSARHAKRHPLETLGRVGYGVKGVLYALLGVIALDAAIGPEDPEGQEGAFATLAQQSYGEVLLWVLVVGLAAYALWRVVLAITDPEGEGDDVEGAGKRFFYVVSAVAYGSLAYSAYRVVSGAGQSSGGGAEDRAQTLLGLPAGRWIVGLLALGLLGYGLYQFVRAYRASFMSNFHLDQRAVQHRDLIKRAGQWGLSARGVVYVLTGTFMAQAALRADADEAGGLDQALGALQRQSYGPWLLGLVAIGFILYGAYCWVNARYRRYEGQ